MNRHLFLLTILGTVLLLPLLKVCHTTIVENIYNSLPTENMVLPSAKLMDTNRKLYILNNSLFFEDTEVVVLQEEQKASYYDLGDLYLVLIGSYILLKEEYSFLYDAQKNKIIQLEFNVDTFFNVYFWNSILIYKVKLKSGGYVLFDTFNRKQTLLHEWIEDFYTINDELCILTINEYKCLTNDKRYKKDTTSMRLTVLERKEAAVR